MLDLLPCPFCGCTAEQDHLSIAADPQAEGDYRVTCSACYADGPTADTPQKAMILWDARRLKGGVRP